MSDLFGKLIRPALFRLPAETAHELGITALRIGLASDSAQEKARKRYAADSFGAIRRFGLDFSSPIGVAAGFDKNGVVVNQLAALGFGFVEVGTVTLHPQAGNPKPRLFRLPDDKALINRLGFNNYGATAVAERLSTLTRRCVVGVNIGKNKDVPNEEAVENYLATLEIVHTAADYITVNVSSPNTPNLRELQKGENLEELLGSLQQRNRELGKKPLFVKIAPDLDNTEIENIVRICLDKSIDGIIATNTTTSRVGLKTPDADRFGNGGLSGKPLEHRSNEVISTIFRLTGGKLPVIGVGGIFTPEDAFEKIAAGACLLQAYTGFVYEGPSFARDVNLKLPGILESHGFRSIDEAVGSGVAQSPT